MLDEAVRLSVSSGEGFGLFRDRAPDTRHANLPAGMRLVSADNHIPIVDDIFYSRFPEHLKEKAPRIWWDEEAGVHQIGVGHKPIIPATAFSLIQSMEDRPGSRDFTERMKDLDAENVAKEICFPQATSMFFNYPDIEVRGWIFKAYNHWIAELQQREPERFFPVAVPNYWYPEQAADSIRDIHALGLKSFQLPTVAGKNPEGKSIIWSNPEYEDMWRTAEELGLPVCFHVGERFTYEGLNGQGPLLLYQIGSSQFRNIFGELVFGLVLDKFPGLKIVFAEAGINWVAGMIQDAETLSNHHALLFESRPRHRPSHYWHTNCYATFQDDAVGLRLLDIIGADRVMWGVDYPHNEGVFGYTHEAIQRVMDVTTEDEARLILGGTCEKVFGI